MRKGRARRSVENWREARKRRRLKSFETFADMIERRFDGLAASGRSENEAALGFIEGFDDEVRVIRRRAYGLREGNDLRVGMCS